MMITKLLEMFLELLELTGIYDVPFNKLSGGQKQMVVNSCCKKSYSGYSSSDYG